MNDDVLQQASAAGYKLIDARGSAWSQWTPPKAVGQDWVEATCDDFACCYSGLGGVCCFMAMEPQVYIVDEAALAYLQLNAVGDFPPVIDPSEFDGAVPEEDEEYGFPPVSPPGLGIGAASSSVPWWVWLAVLALLMRKRKRR